MPTTTIESIQNTELTIGLVSDTSEGPPSPHCAAIAEALCGAPGVRTRIVPYGTSPPPRLDVLLGFPSAGTCTAELSGMLALAMRSGAVTNHVWHDEAWGRKDTLEYALRAYTRLTGVRVPRPETWVAAAWQVPAAVASFWGRGLSCVLKPANGARGERLRILRPGEPPPPLACGDWIVQELVDRPLVVDDRKVDFRCYIVMDTADRTRSGWHAPLFVRAAGIPHDCGGEAAEVTNCAFRKHYGLPGGMYPLDQAGFPCAVASAVTEGANAVIAALLDARFVRAAALVPGDSLRRILLWGVDLIASRHGDEIRVQLLEINVFPHLLIGCEKCDPVVADLLRGPFLDSIQTAVGV